MPHQSASAAGAVRVVIVGGGVGGLEAMLALHDLAGPRVHITLVDPDALFRYRPWSVIEPFGGFAAPAWRRDQLAFRFGASFVLDRVEAVDTDRRVVRLACGNSVAYDVLILCAGARRGAPDPAAITLGLPEAGRRLREASARFGDAAGRVHLVAPPGEHWTVPLYETALLLRRDMGREQSSRVALRVVTHEAAPLQVLGPRAGEALTQLMEEHEIGFQPNTAWLPGSHSTLAVSLPVHRGITIDGVPHDADGFIAVDDHGRVGGLEGVYAAGDAASLPVKQGGLAAQLAVAAARHIAQLAGAGVDATPFRPVLRARVHTGYGALYISRALDGDDPGEVSREPLWDPPHKMAAQYLSHWLAWNEHTAAIPSTPVRAIPLG